MAKNTNMFAHETTEYSWVLKRNNYTFTKYEDFRIWGSIYLKQKFLKEPLTEDEQLVYEGGHIKLGPYQIKLVPYQPIWHPAFLMHPDDYYDYAMKKLHLRMLDYDDSRMITSLWKGAKSTYYNPLREFPELFKIFAALDPNNDDAILEFISKYGSLSFTGKADKEKIHTLYLNYPYQQIATKNKEGYHRCIFRSVVPEDKTDDIAGYHHLTTYGSTIIMWFEPLQWFKNELIKYKNIYQNYLTLKKLEANHRRELSDGIEVEDWEKWKREGEPKLTLLRQSIQRGINRGLDGATLAVNQDGVEEFYPVYRINTLYHALYFQLYQLVVENKLAVCATPGCNTVFWKTRANQLHCSRECGSRARANYFYQKKKALCS